MNKSDLKSNAAFVVKHDDSGLKIIATEYICAGMELCSFTGIPITYGDTLKLGPEESFALQTDKNLYLYLDEPYRYFNHSCEPNCGLNAEQKLICLKDIEKGEELRYDYSTTMMERHWTMKCSCKSASCRGVVGDFDTLPEATRDYYLRKNVVQAFIVKAMYAKIQKIFIRKGNYQGVRMGMRRSSQ